MKIVPPQRLVGYLMVITASILFGINGTLSRLLFDTGVSPVTLVEFRLLIGGVVLLAISGIWWRRELKLPKRDLGWIVAFGLSLALLTYFYFVAISRLPLAVALIIQFSAPIWMALGESIWRRHLPSWPVCLAILLTLAGVALLTGLWNQHLNGLDLVGVLYSILALLAFIAYLLLGRRIGRHIPALSATTYGALVASVFWFFVQPPWLVPASTWQPGHIILIVLVGIVGMAIPFSLELGSLRRLDPTRVGIASMMELVAGAIVAYFVLKQALSLWQILGCLTVLVGIIILQFEQRPAVLEDVPPDVA